MICSSQYWSLSHMQESLLKQTKWERNTEGTKAKVHTPSNQSFQRAHVQVEVAPQESWCSQGTLKLPGTIANYWHLGISSSNMLSGYFSTSKKANYNVFLLVSGIYSLLLHRLLFFPLLGSSNQIPQNKRWREIWIKSGSSPSVRLHRKQHCSIPGQHGRFWDEMMPFPLYVYLGKTLNAINHTISTAYLEEMVRIAIRLARSSNQQQSQEQSLANLPSYKGHPQ